MVRSIQAAVGREATAGGEAGADADSEEPDESTDTAVAATTGPGWRKLLRSGDASRRQDREQMFYPLWIEPKSQKIVRVGERLPLSTSPSYEADEDGLLPVWPIRQNGTEGRWGVGAPTLHTLVEQGFVKVGRYVQTRNTWGVSYLTRQIVADITAGKYSVESRDPITDVATVVTVGVAERRIKTVWFRKRHNAGVGGTALVSKLVGTDRPFSFPKSLYAVRDTLAMLVKDKKEALVMDFFAGSGTTLHATAMLNAEDGGKRRCVLITNNDVDEKTSKGAQRGRALRRRSSVRGRRHLQIDDGASGPSGHHRQASAEWRRPRREVRRRHAPLHGVQGERRLLRPQLRGRRRS